MMTFDKADIWAIALALIAVILCAWLITGAAAQPVTQEWMDEMLSRLPAQKTPMPKPDPRPSGYVMDKCWVDVVGNAPRDPFDNAQAFSCMLNFGYRYCRDCASSQKVLCKRHRGAPRDRLCWEHTMFPDPHPLGEMP